MSMSSKTKKIRAITAGGAVLGLGAMITLAAWSDSEFAQGTFASRTFGIQAAANGGTFADYSDSNGALSLTAEPKQLSPGETAYYSYQISMIEGAVDTTVNYMGATSTGTDSTLYNSLDILVLPTTGTVCDESVTGTSITSFDLTSLAPQKDLCIQVKLKDAYDVATSKESTITWEFEAVETAAVVI